MVEEEEKEEHREVVEEDEEEDREEEGCTQHLYPVIPILNLETIYFSLTCLTVTAAHKSSLLINSLKWVVYESPKHIMTCYLPLFPQVSSGSIFSTQTCMVVL